MELGEKIFRWIIRSTNRSMTIMRRSIKYIVLALVAVVWTVACVNEMELSEPILEQQQLTLVPRVHSFANQYVTKANPYDNTETKITQLIVLVFNKEGVLAHIQHQTFSGGAASSVSLNKSMLNLPQAKIVLIANMPLDKIAKTTSEGSTTETTTLADVKEGKKTLTLSDLQNYSFHYEDDNTVITDLKGGFSGFPMIGTVEGVVDLVAGNQEAIEVAMKILYAKINFVIGVASSTENTNTSSTTPSFKLTGYSVYNASKATLIADPTATADSDNPTAGNVPTASDVYAYENTDPNAAANANNLGRNVPSSNPADTSFTFYVSESRFNHGISDETLANIYPSWIADLTNSEQDTELKNSVMQKYKPVLATYSEEAQPGKGLATFVLLKGDYTDYRGTVWNVNYKVYLGKDNTQNFQVDRNSEYINKITIKGIRNYDAEDGRGEVWIDHRVDVEGTGTDSAAECVTITRETLIDAHIEVRPLRVSWPEEKYAVAKLYLPTDSIGNLLDWIGIERFIEGVNNQDESVYCFQTTAEGERKSTGKRRYFTETLISELQNKDGDYGVLEESDGRKYIYLNNGECAWIYFDENTFSGGIPNQEREAKITLQFFPTTGSSIVTEEYHIRQRGLLNVGGYSIESYEEYLHTYDSADDYNLSTSPVDYTQKGLAWGLDGRSISKYILLGDWEINKAAFDDLREYRYDYMRESDKPSGYYSYSEDPLIKENYGTGLIFTDRASYNEGITVRDMGTFPENAYQYCLSKNKFAVDEDGNVSMKIHWYLPDAYEMQSVLKANQSGGRVADFATDANYWSSQPSFITVQNPGLLYIGRDVIDEDPTKAIAVTVSGKSDPLRKEKHRIRCLYSKDGLTADMEDRTPDGVGGNYSFTMKAYDGAAAGYFNSEVLGLAVTPGNPVTTEDFQRTNEHYEYPTFENQSLATPHFGFFSGTQGNNVITGFSKDPANPSNWDHYVADRTYYTTLWEYPGLSPYELEQYVDKGQAQEAYKPTNTVRSDRQVKSVINTKQLSKLIVVDNNQQLNPQLMIKFNSPYNSTNSPKFEFLEYASGSQEVVTTKYWRVPTYEEVNLSSEGGSFTEPITGDTGTGTATVWRGQYDEGEAAAIQEAEQQAYINAINKAKSKYEDRAFVIEEVEYNTKVKDEGGFLRTTFTATSTCTITISSVEKYYADATNGGWSEGTSETKSLAGVQTDELRVYCGNSFTISCADGYEITKVKVHYSGSNLVGSPGTSDNVYARFVNNQIVLPVEETVDKQNWWTEQPKETIKLEGMDYSDGTGGGWHQWSGAGTEEITLVLSLYKVNNNQLDRSFTYRYDNDRTYADKYIVVDKIEVKCTPKKTTDETTP